MTRIIYQGEIWIANISSATFRKMKRRNPDMEIEIMNNKTGATKVVSIYQITKA